MVALLCSTVVLSAAAAGSVTFPDTTISGGKATFKITVSGGGQLVKGVQFNLSATGGTVDSVTSSVSGLISNYNPSSGLYVYAGNSGNASVTFTVVCTASSETVKLSYSGMTVGDDGDPAQAISVTTSGSATAKAASTTKPTTKPVATTKPTTTKPTTTKPTTTASTAANLKSLSVDGYSISPKFSQGRTSYKLEVPADFAGKLDVKAVPLDSAANVTVTGNDITEGKGTIKITVKGTDGTTKTYRITVAPPTETTTEAPVVAEGLKLSTLKVGAGLAIDFQPDVLAYTVKVPAGTKSLDVEALIGEVEGATVRVEGADDLAASNNVVKVIVTDANGVETVYTINVVEETPLAQAPATQDDEKKGGMPVWLAIMLILLAFILGLVIGFLLGKKKAEDDYYDDDDDDTPPIFGGSADEVPAPDPIDTPVSSPYSGGMNFNPPSLGGAEFKLPYEAAGSPTPAAPTTTPVAPADSFIQSAD